MNFVDLLENYLILKERDKELYYDIKDNIDKYKSFIYDNLAYDIIIKDDFIKLEKIPGIPEEWMGISEFTEIKEYIFFILLIINSQLINCSGNNPVCLNPIGLILKVRFLYVTVHWSGTFFLYSHLPPPLEDR